ncbi:MAG: nickel-dependent hydrogenase large subunit [Burkholderiales bacterium]|nr:nickel-dependent hydrogenase large subunit [Burkholderiales bacterium]
MSRQIVGPFNRVEGDLEVTLDVVDGRVAAAHVNAPMYRGFEQILQGKAPRDALVIVPRICGICSVTQSVAAANALAALAGVTPPRNGRLATQITLATENLADHLTHFYLFFMPDFSRPAYSARAWWAEAVRRYDPQTGERTRAATAARQRWMTLMGTLAGKWPHTMSIEPGGSSRAIEAGERVRLLAKVREFQSFVETTLLGDSLARLAEIDSLAALWAWVDEAPQQGDLRFFLGLARDLDLAHLGTGPGRYLCHGAYPEDDGAWLAPPGLWRASDARLHPLDLGKITEDASHAWMAEAGAPRHPSRGLTEPDPDKPGAYSWSKAPRLGGEVVEAGAIARQLAAGHPLLLDAVARTGGNVLTRVLARVVEIAVVLPHMARWLRELHPGEPWCVDAHLPADGDAVGLTEAARGALGHWLRVQGGRIASYQIVAPTTWNFSPRDAAGTPGALEAALVGTPVSPGAATPVAVQHVVRSFDPCMVCTVH